MSELTLFKAKSPRESFLVGVFTTWLTHGKAPTKEQNDLAEKAARAAMAVLETRM